MNKALGFSLIGSRVAQQDRFFIREDSDCLLAVVCDGHGIAGDLVAELAISVLTREISGDASDEIITEAFRKADQEIGEKYLGGTTAVVVLVKNNGEVIVAYVGDSEVLAFEPQIQEVEKLLPFLHLVSEPSEQARLVQMGAELYSQKLQVLFAGAIVLSRALGDVKFGKFLIPDPTIVRLSPNEVSRFSRLLIVSDGLSAILENCRTLGISSAENFRLFNGCELIKSVAKAVGYLAWLRLDDNTTGVLINLDLWRCQNC